MYKIIGLVSFLPAIGKLIMYLQSYSFEVFAPEIYVITHLIFFSCSDMEIILEGDEKLPAHKFVLNARSTKWNLNSTNLLDWSHLPKDVGMAILSWIYNDQVTKYYIIRAASEPSAYKKVLDQFLV